ncbi:ATP-dependent RNA helicase dbp10 [Sporothrix bragantina]|uniref:RNA helicase n=1 Tax=Sporothrix bragantina TaxID=671064 RepID=A0ABP0C8M0_9PEZI
MSARLASPTPSENEVDILGDLLGDDFDGFGSDNGDGFDFDEEEADDNSSRKRSKKNKTKAAALPNDDDLDLGAILEGGGFTDASNGLPNKTKNGIKLTGPNAEEILDDDEDEAYIALQQAAAFRKSSNLKGGSASVKGGGFQAMGLNPTLMRAITRKGFTVPTPIQRKTIPLILGRRDVVGMARTGSGKTAAFVIPMIQRLRAHSVRVGARALIMSPSRELAMQTLKVVKELGRDTDLKTVLLVGGDSLEEQFAMLASNPDIVIATPGRFLHLKVEMNLDLSSIKYVVFDEADRLFEMGFAAQLTEILHALPPSRQTLLFSATLPSSLVEFARAGLQDPSLVRLDIETKISPKLKSAFFSVKGPEKEGALLHLLHDVIKIPLGLPEAALKAREESRRNGGDGEGEGEDGNPRKRKRLNSGYVSSKVAPTQHSTIVFAATKHHVEYLAAILSEAGFAVSYVYGSLDQTARRIQVENFRHGRSNIMVVTDLAARGIDIPVLANVVNYDFPPQAKVFVHRVGRTARADQEGNSYSFVQDTDAPYLVDLQLFLGRKMIVGRDSPAYDLTRDIVVGSLARGSVEPHVEWVTTLLGDVHDIEVLRQVASKAQKQYFRTRLSASSQSAKRAREMVRGRGWSQLHPIFGDNNEDGEGGSGGAGADSVALGVAREDLLAQISGYKPVESIFEVHHQNKKAMKSKAAEVMRTMRKRAGPRRISGGAGTTLAGADEDDEVDAEAINGADYEEGIAALANGGGADSDDDDDEEEDGDDKQNQWEDDDEENDDADVLEAEDAWAVDGEGSKNASWVDSSVFMSYTPRTGPSMGARAVEERGYGVHGRGGDDDGEGSGFNSFAAAARDATMDLTNDDTAKAFGVPTRSKLRWDKKQGKYVARANDEDGSRVQSGKGGGKMIRGESGVKIAASFQSGRFDKWRKANRLGRLPQVGEAERSGLARQVQNPLPGAGGANGRGGFNAGPGTGRFMHKKELAPKEADKFRDNYEIQKKRVAEARENRVGRFKDGEGSYTEVKDMDHVRKNRKILEQKRLKNARPARDGGSSRGGSGGGRGRGGGRGGGGRGGGGRGGRGGRGRG